MVNIIKNINSTKNIKKDIEFVEKYIKKDTLKDITIKIRNTNDEKEKRELKSKLPVALFSCLIKENMIHSINNIEEHTNLLILDYDHIDNIDELNIIIEKLKKDNRIHFLYKSASGKGFKIVIKVYLDTIVSINSDMLDEQVNKAYNEAYKIYYDYIDNLFFDIIGYNADQNAKDISRCSYLAYDPDCYFNKDSEIIKIDKNILTIKKEENIFLAEEEKYEEATSELKEECDYLINVVRKYNLAVAQEYNNWFYFANLFLKIYTAKEAILRFHIISKICDNYDETAVDKKLKTIINNPKKGDTTILAFYKLLSDFDYKLNRDFVRKEIENHKLSLLSDDDYKENDTLKKTPTINDDKVYNYLPNLLKDMCSNFTDPREKDIFLTSELTALSTLFENNIGVYFGDETIPNIYSYIIAPAASSKSIAKYSIDTLHDVYKLFQEEYQLKLQSCEDEISQKNVKEKTLFLSEDSSSRALFDQLYINNGSGLLFLSEADTLVNNQKNEWGDITVLLRKGIHNEKSDLARKGETLKIDKIKMSVILTGTFSSAVNFINSENGTLSRFLYYTFDRDFYFKNPAIIPNRNKIFKKYAPTIRDMFEYYRDNNTTIEWEDPERQGDIFEKFFNKKYNKIKMMFDNDIESIITRYGILTFKIASLLQFINEFENRDIFKKKLEKIYLSDKYIKVALNLMSVYFKHAEIIFNNVNDKSKVEVKENKNEKIVNYILNIKETFKADKIKDFAKLNNISEVTVKRILSLMVKDLQLIKIDKMHYKVKNLKKVK